MNNQIPVQPISNYEQPNTNIPKKKMSIKTKFTIGLVVVILIQIIMIVVILNKDDRQVQDKPTTSTTTTEVIEEETTTKTTTTTVSPQTDEKDDDPSFANGDYIKFDLDMYMFNHNRYVEYPTNFSELDFFIVADMEDPNSYEEKPITDYKEDGLYLYMKSNTVHLEYRDEAEVLKDATVDRPKVVYFKDRVVNEKKYITLAVQNEDDLLYTLIITEDDLNNKEYKEYTLATKRKIEEPYIIDTPNGVEFIALDRDTRETFYISTGYEFQETVAYYIPNGMITTSKEVYIDGERLPTKVAMIITDKYEDGVIIGFVTENKYFYRFNQTTNTYEKSPKISNIYYAMFKNKVRLAYSDEGDKILEDVTIDISLQEYKEMSD